ncbi:BTB/POZ domain-containing protein 1-like [Mizuhopecten yessoensis]|uniref:BTB/POZ domain-containing protein 2 n=1 Tax=Mizuhopecten yessoensis TaxID=6573 RepID=A0A210QKZ4_MIZYE|nr:BTB/POZ domain-containing protein 1-like [Mizuhopecten yessoensis]XP_021355892.1 BTB/POZ domain-containing protein 1-like [Mizuhopecten yessoensis]OWF49321.1 BTB/POZ domain-containing protein 2 [Mizuhopecten yessoensis]
MATSGTPNDWQSGKTLSQCMDHVLTSGTSSDVTFLVGEDKKRIPAHKLILISRSPVFYAMLEGPMAEKGEIAIPDITEDVFQHFLRYLYTDTIDLTEMNVVPVLNAARKYCVDILVTNCEDFLTKSLSAENACLFLEHAHVFLMDKLKTECLKVISESSTDVLQSQAFSDLCPSCLTSITESDDLAADESDVYKAVIRWAEAECSRQNTESNPENKRQVLGDSLHTVRFPKIDSDFFFKQVCLDKVLPGDMVLDVINCIMHDEVKDVPWLNLNARKYTISTRESVWRFKDSLNGVWPGTCYPEAISFQVPFAMKLYGTGSFLTSTEPSTVDIEVYDGYTLLYSGSKLPLVKNDSINTGDVVLAEPIRLLAGKTYTIKEEPSAIKQHYSETGLENVDCKGRTITFIHSSMSRGSTVRRGQIPFLIIGS